MERMAWRLNRPLITVSCHDDVTASDLVGRYLVTGGELNAEGAPVEHDRALMMSSAH